MNETIITWNVTNWITIVLMAALGFAVLAFAAQLYHSNKSSGNSSTSGST